MGYGSQSSYGGYRAPVRRAPIAPRPTPPSPATGLGATLGLSTQSAAKPAFTNQQLAATLGPGHAQAAPNIPPGTNLTHPAAAPAAGAPSAADTSYDYNADPILNQIKALSSQSRGDATSNALMLRKQLAVDYGDTQLGQQYGGDATAQAATGNPFSVRHQLDQGYQQGQQQLEQQYNDQNLFYGGARAKGLSDFATQYQGQQYGAAGQERTALQSITDQLAAALYAADQQDAGGQRDASGRAIDSGAGGSGGAADQQGGLPGGGGGAGSVVGGINGGGYNPLPAPAGPPVVGGINAGVFDPMPAAAGSPGVAGINQGTYAPLAAALAGALKAPPRKKR
jgi:hypothetical protein